MQSKTLIFAVTLFLVAALVYSSLSISMVVAVPRDPNYVPNEKCTPNMDGTRLTCCWDEPDILNPGEFIRWCQSCDFDGENCGEISLKSISTGPLAPLEDGVLEQTPTPPPSGPAAPLQGGVLEQQVPPTTAPSAPGASPGVLEQPPPPATEGTQPLSEEEEPVPLCPEDQVLDEETGLCVLEEPEAAEQSEQSTEDGDGSEDNSDN